MAQAMEDKVCGTDFKEAVCINTSRIYDSCCDKDCLQDMQVYFPESAQAAIDGAVSVRGREVEILDVYIDVEPLPFNRGYYSVDMTFFFGVDVLVTSSPFTAPTEVRGVAVFSKKSILYGSEGNVRVFSSGMGAPQGTLPTSNMPKATVHIFDSKQTKRALGKPKLFFILGFSFIFAEQGLEFVHKGIDVGEAAVNGSESDVSDLVDIFEFSHCEFADFIGRYLVFERGLQRRLYLINSLFDTVDGNGTLFASSEHTVENLVSIKNFS